MGTVVHQREVKISPQEVLPKRRTNILGVFEHVLLDCLHACPDEDQAIYCGKLQITPQLRLALFHLFHGDGSEFIVLQADRSERLAGLQLVLADDDDVASVSLSVMSVRDLWPLN